MKMLFAFALLLCLTRLGTAAPAFDNSEAGSVAKDATGAVWARQNSDSPGEISRWHDGAWKKQAVPGAADFTLRALTRGGDGSVYALWQQDNYQQTDHGWVPVSRCLITVHRGSVASVLARFDGGAVSTTGYVNAPTLLAGTGGNVWVAGYQPLFWHITQGSVKEFPLKRDWYFDGKLPAGQPAPGFFSHIDAAGRRWLWQDGAHSDRQRSGLRGVLIWDGKTLDYHPTLAGMPDQAYTAAAPLDADHFLLATGDRPGGTTGCTLYRVDTRTLSAVPELPRQVFQNVTQLMQTGGDLYAVDKQPDAKAALWRRRSGVWKKIAASLDTPGSADTPDLHPPWLATPTGTWLGVNGGAWWLPTGGRPALRADWRRGVPNVIVRSLVRLTNGDVLASGERGTGQMPPIPQKGDRSDAADPPAGPSTASRPHDRRNERPERFGGAGR